MSRSAERSKCLTSKKCQQLILAMAINAANAAKQYFNTFPFLSCAFWYLYLWQSMLQIFQFFGKSMLQMSQNIVLLLFHFHSVGLTLLRASFDQHCNFFPQSPSAAPESNYILHRRPIDLIFAASFIKDFWYKVQLHREATHSHQPPALLLPLPIHPPPPMNLVILI